MPVINARVDCTATIIHERRVSTRSRHSARYTKSRLLQRPDFPEWTLCGIHKQAENAQTPT